MFTQGRAGVEPTPGRALADFLNEAQAVITGMSLQAISEGSELSPKGYHAEVSKAMTLITKGEQIFIQGTQVTGFNVDNFASLYLFGVKATITGMGFQASSEGSKQSPKAFHEVLYCPCTVLYIR